MLDNIDYKHLEPDPYQILVDSSQLIWKGQESQLVLLLSFLFLQEDFQSLSYQGTFVLPFPPCLELLQWLKHLL